MKIAIGNDHGGLNLKAAVIGALKEEGAEVVNFGTDTPDSVDYPDFALKVAEEVASGEADAGVLLCGTGIGISIAANKVKGIRCAVVVNEFTAEATKEHNNANVIAMGGRVITPDMAAKCTKIWLETKFAGGRHQNRLDKIAKIEEKYFK